MTAVIVPSYIASSVIFHWERAVAGSLISADVAGDHQETCDPILRRIIRCWFHYWSTRGAWDEIRWYTKVISKQSGSFATDTRTLVFELNSSQYKSQ